MIHPARLHVDSSPLADLMTCASPAVTAAGNPCWELTCLGIPMVTIVAAANQAPVARTLRVAGASENAGEVDDAFDLRLPERVVAFWWTALDAVAWRYAAGAWIEQRAIETNSMRAPDLLHTLEDYAAEMRQFPYTRSFEAVESLARVRGAAAGLDATECFMLVREFVR